jgi:hypothetical protein
MRVVWRKRARLAADGEGGLSIRSPYAQAVKECAKRRGILNLAPSFDQVALYNQFVN